MLVDLVDAAFDRSYKQVAKRLLKLRRHCGIGLLGRLTGIPGADRTIFIADFIDEEDDSLEAGYWANAGAPWSAICPAAGRLPGLSFSDARMR